MTISNPSNLFVQCEVFLRNFSAPDIGIEPGTDWRLTAKIPFSAFTDIGYDQWVVGGPLSSEQTAALLSVAVRRDLMIDASTIEIVDENA